MGRFLGASEESASINFESQGDSEDRAKARALDPSLEVTNERAV